VSVFKKIVGTVPGAYRRDDPIVVAVDAFSPGTRRFLGRSGV